MCAFAEKIRRKAEVVNARYREEIKHLITQRDREVCDKDGDFEKQIDWHVIDARKEGRNTEVRHLPLHLEVYALNRYPILRRVYVDSEVEFGHLFPRLVLFREETYNGGEIEMMWMALYRNEPEDGGLVVISAWHGSPLSQVIYMAANPHSKLTRGPRNFGRDKVQPDEAYAADFLTSMYYTLNQQLLGERVDSDDVICCFGVAVVSARKSKSSARSIGQKGHDAKSARIVLVKQAQVEIILMRADNGKSTLRPQDRCMQDWAPRVVDHEADVLEERARKENNANRAPLSKKTNRRVDPELAENAKKMKEKAEEEDHPTSNTEKRQRLEDEGGVFEEHPENQRGWKLGGWPIDRFTPDGRVVAKSTFRYIVWHKEGAALHTEDGEKRYIWPTQRPEEEVEESLAKQKSRHPSTKANHEILKDLKLLRKGMLKVPESYWKKYELNELAFCLRHGSIAMLISLAHTVRDRLLVRQKELSQILDLDIAFAPGSSIPIRKELEEVKKDLTRCVAQLDEQKRTNSENYRDARYVHQLDRGDKRYACTLELKNRVYSGIHLMSERVSRGQELLHFREKELARETREGRPDQKRVDWSDDEDNIEDDVPLKATEKLTIRPSRAYIAKEIDPEWNTEVSLNLKRKRTVKDEGGHFNYMDGRYHPDERSEKTLKREHAKRTSERRFCKYFHGREGCRKGFDCTMRHDDVSEDEEDTYRHFGSSSSLQYYHGLLEGARIARDERSRDTGRAESSKKHRQHRS